MRPVGQICWSEWDRYLFILSHWSVQGERIKSPHAVYPCMDDEPTKVIRITYNDGVYVGQYVEVDGTYQEHGVGVFNWSNGDSYEGEFSFGRRHGTGVFTWADGKRYEGDFEEDVRKGTGSLAWPDGTTYDGDFDNGNLHGKGRLRWPSGEVYLGWFENGQMCGFGIRYDKDGNVIEQGEWYQNCLVNPQ